MNLKDVYLNDTINLKGVRLDHPWISVLPENTLVKLVRYYDIKDKLEPDSDLDVYFRISGINFMYPMFFLGALLGFAFRSISGKEFTVKNRYPMIGFTCSEAMEKLGNYKGSWNQPLVLVEGVSDAEAVSKMYPWVIAVMGNRVKNTMT